MLRTARRIGGTFVGGSTLSSMKLFVVMITVSFTVQLSESYLMKPSHDKTIQPSQIIQMVYMIFGLAVMIGFCAWERGLWVRRGMVDNEHYRIDAVLISAGLTIFFIFSAVFGIFYLLAAFSCFNVFKLCSWRTFSPYLNDVIFSFTRIVYISVQTMFCVIFRHARFHNNGFVRHALLFLQATNLALWFDILVIDYSYRFDQPLLWLVDKECLKRFDNRSEDFKCVTRNTTLYYILIYQITPHFNQFPYEFTLLVGERLMFWYMHCNSEPHESTDPDDVTTDLIMCPMTDPEVDNRHENDPLLGVEQPPRSSLHHSLMSKLYILTSILLNMVYSVFALLLSTLPKVEEYKNAFFIYGDIYWALMSASIILGVYKLGTVDPVDQPTRNKFYGLHCLLILSSIGPLSCIAFSQYAWFSSITEDGTQGFEARYHVNAFVYFASDILVVVYVYLQISFCFHLDRIAFSLIPTRQTSDRLTFLTTIALHLAIVNLSQWVVDSFATYNNNDDLYLAKMYFDETKWWTVINGILPLNVFFWFNSFLLCIKTCLIVRQRRSRSGSNLLQYTGSNG